MKNHYVIYFLYLIIVSNSFSQGFNLASTGLQTFYFKDIEGRNQTTFFSHAPFEDMTGISTDVWGQVTLDLHEVVNTLSGEISISTNSIETGIDKRDEFLHGLQWLNAEKYSTISYRIIEVKNITVVEDSEIKLVVSGEFSLRGITKVIFANVTLKYLEESQLTKIRMPGDLLSVSAAFKINLSDFGINHTLIGKRVANEIEISANIIGSNAAENN